MNLNLEGKDLERRVAQWADLASELANNHGLPRFQLVSDTLFAGAPPDAQGLALLVDFSKELLAAGIDSFLPLRGGLLEAK